MGRAVSPHRVFPMNALDTLKSLAPRGMELVELIHAHVRGAESVSQLARDLGWPSERVRKVARLGKILHSRTTSPEDAALRKKTLTLSRDYRLSLDHLLCIQASVTQLHDSTQTETIRHRITALAHDKSVDELKTAARHIVSVANSETPPPTSRMCTISKDPDPAGNKHLHLRLPAAEMNRIASALHTDTRRRMHARPELSYAHALGEVVTRLLSFPGEKPEAPQEYQPAVLLSMADYTAVDPVNRLFATTDGSILTPEQFARTKLAEIGYTVVYDADAQPVDLFRIERVANAKQRIILATDQLLCAHPGCQRPALTCQAHHLKPWKDGGETNLSNLTALCGTHNRENDDDNVGKNLLGRNGHAVRDKHSGVVGWQPPDPTKPPRYNMSPLVHFSGRAWANDQRR